MNRMNWHTVVNRAVTALAAVLMALAACLAAVSQEAKPERPQTSARESAKSSPPDTNRYVRPAIPEDRLNTPSPPGRASPPGHDDPGSAQPRLR